MRTNHGHDIYDGVTCMKTVNLANGALQCTAMHGSKGLAACRRVLGVFLCVPALFLCAFPRVHAVGVLSIVCAYWCTYMEEYWVRGVESGHRMYIQGSCAVQDSQTLSSHITYVQYYA